MWRKTKRFGVFGVEFTLLFEHIVIYIYIYIYMARAVDKTWESFSLCQRGGGATDMIFVKSFTQALYQQIWKFTQNMRKFWQFWPPKTQFFAIKFQKMWELPTVLLK